MHEQILEYTRGVPKWRNFFFFCTMWILALNLGSNLHPLLWKSLNHWTHQGSPRVEELILGIVTIYL